MNEAIKLAIEKGGYYQDKQFPETVYMQSMYRIICDPLFWQALGKALGWTNFSPTERFEVLSIGLVPKDWLTYALNHHRLILTGGETEKFWKELLSEKTQHS